MKNKPNAELLQHLLDSNDTKNSDLDEKLTNAEHAVKLSQELGDKVSQAKAYQNLTYIYFSQDLDIAKDYAQKALTLFKTRPWIKKLLP